MKNKYWIVNNFLWLGVFGTLLGLAIHEIVAVKIYSMTAMLAGAVVLCQLVGYNVQQIIKKSIDYSRGRY